MGLLDDAIREHLDLKRRRGADPTEVEREEREVLGPVRRRGEEPLAEEQETAYLHEDELEPEPLAHDSMAWDEGHAEVPLPSEPLPPAAAYEHDQIAPLEPDPGPYVPPAREPERHVPPVPEPEPYVPPVPEPAPYAAPEPEPHLYHDEPPATGETVEYNVDEAIEQEDPPRGDGEEEDVLEETPDFLQDTPDHDRLWFEQRPPRDFDFDG